MQLCVWIKMQEGNFACKTGDWQITGIKHCHSAPCGTQRGKVRIFGGEREDDLQAARFLIHCGKHYNRCKPKRLGMLSV